MLFSSSTTVIFVSSIVVLLLQVVNGGLSEDPIELFAAPPNINVFTEPGGREPFAMVTIPAFQYENKLYFECNDFIVQNPVKFYLGDTPVICRAQGFADSTLSFIVSVASDCEAPVFTSCALEGGAVKTAASSTAVSYTPPTASDNDGIDPTVTCDPPPGSMFPLGFTPVTCTATDSFGNTATVKHFVSVTEIPGVVGCGPHQLTDGATGECTTCPDGQTPNDNGVCTHCAKGQVRGNRDGTGASACIFAHGICEVWEKGVNGKCKSCPAGKIGKEDERGCRHCDAGTVRGNSAGTLLSECVPASGVCDENEIGVAGKCMACQDRFSADVSFVQCIPDRSDINTR